MKVIGSFFSCCLINLIISDAVNSGPTPSVGNDNNKAEKSGKISENSLIQPLTKPSSCRCLPVNKECKLPMPKLMALAIPCLEAEQYCCDEKTDDTKADDKTDFKTNQTREIQPPQTPRIRIRLPLEDVAPSSSSTQDLLPSNNRLAKPQIRCTCRLREDCKDKYTDYTFGFHCSYDKVRCCEPHDQILKEMSEKSGGRLISVEINHEQSPATAASNNDVCKCVTGLECSILGLNIVKEGKVASCPFELVKCCETSITKKSDTYTAEGNGGAQWNLSLEDESEGRGMGINIHGQPAFRQPIQLPNPKIPMADNNKTEWIMRPPVASDPLVQSEVVQSPPELPTHYQHERPILHQSPPPPTNFFQQGVRRPPIQQYYGGVGPHIPESHPVPYYRIATSSGPFEGSTGRSGHQPSLIDSITNFFFG